MENSQTTSEKSGKKQMSYGKKVFYLALQCCALMIGAFTIWIMSESRDERNRDVRSQIMDKWGESVFINGPVIKERLDTVLWLQPETFTCNANVETKSLHRNIYEAEVFNAHIAMSGSFNKDSIAIASDSVFIKLDVETKQIEKLSPLIIGGDTIDWRKTELCLIAKVDLSDMPEVIEFSTDFDIRGSSALFIKQIGYSSSVTIDGEAPNPSFRGCALPSDRYVSRGLFRARWEDDDETPLVNEVAYETDNEYVGMNFLVGVDRYQKVSRSLKYAFIIIVLTYISVLFTEILMKRKIPLLNYFLTGAALIIFYTLLLSFAEYLSFGMAYSIASVMTILLITGYMWKMLGSLKIGIIIGLLLTVLYLSCYILLSLSMYSLLLGSLMLFVAVAAMMYGSLKIKQ